MKRSINIFLALILGTASFAQDDEQKAKEILDRVSEKTQAYKTVIIDFTVTVMPPDGDPMEQDGKAYMKDEKYKAELEDQDIYCDGKTVTTYLKEENECYTSEVEGAEEGEIVSPSELLTIWEEGYKFRYDKETTYEGIPVHQIYLYPKDPANTNIHTIVIRVDKAKDEVVFVLIKTKDGVKTKYHLKKMQKDVDIPDSKFIFDRSKHPGVECYEE